MKGPGTGFEPAFRCPLASTRYSSSFTRRSRSALLFEGAYNQFRHPGPALILCAALAGCAQIPADPTRMSPEQLREFARDKNANASCTVLNSPYGRGVMSYLVLDKAVVVNGTVSIDNECRITITNSPKPDAPPALEPASRAGMQPMNCYRAASAVICEPIK